MNDEITEAIILLERMEDAISSLSDVYVDYYYEVLDHLYKINDMIN